MTASFISYGFMSCLRYNFMMEFFSPNFSSILKVPSHSFQNCIVILLSSSSKSQSFLLSALTFSFPIASAKLSNQTSLFLKPHTPKIIRIKLVLTQLILPSFFWLVFYRRSPHGTVPPPLRHANLCHNLDVCRGNAVVATIRSTEMGIGVIIHALLVAW